jgi:L-ribulose-5-phosphate 3-epimerase
MLNFGIRAHDYGQGTPIDIAAKLAPFGASCIQLALAKSFPFIKEIPGQLSPGLANHVRDVFAAQGINIAVLGCYINPIHPDPLLKEQSLLRFEEHLRFARDFGCAIVGTETGSRSADCTYHPDSQNEDAFLELVDSVKRLAVTAEKYGSIVGIEGVAHHHVIHTYSKMVRMLELVDSPNVQVIYDPVNFFPLDQCDKQELLMEQAFEMFGDRIVAIHSKDFVLKDGLKHGDLPAGTGLMNHRHLFSLLRKYKPYIHTIMESTNPDNVEQIMTFLAEAAKD